MYCAFVGYFAYLLIIIIRWFIACHHAITVLQVQVGAGTTPGSFQVQPLRDIHAPIGFTLIKSDLSHGSEVYVTVIAENHAGIVRAFQATSPVIVDHTPPDVDKVAVEIVVVNNTGYLELQEDVKVTWSATDETSDINYCTCALGIHNV